MRRSTTTSALPWALALAVLGSACSNIPSNTEMYDQSHTKGYEDWEPVPLRRPPLRLDVELLPFLWQPPASIGADQTAPAPIMPSDPRHAPVGRFNEPPLVPIEPLLRIRFGYGCPVRLRTQWQWAATPPP